MINATLPEVDLMATQDTSCAELRPRSVPPSHARHPPHPDCNPVIITLVGQPERVASAPPRQNSPHAPRSVQQGEAFNSINRMEIYRYKFKVLV